LAVQTQPKTEKVEIEGKQAKTSKGQDSGENKKAQQHTHGE
jgi:hypothetical protein